MIEFQLRIGDGTRSRPVTREKSLTFIDPTLIYKQNRRVGPCLRNCSQVSHRFSAKESAEMTQKEKQSGPDA